MSEIIPAILPTNIADLDFKLSQIPKEVRLVHLDTLEADIWIEPLGINFEVHLMVKQPGEIVERWVKRGAKRIIVHTLEEKISKFKGKVEIGLAVELETPLEEVSPLVPQIDFIHLMSIAQIGAQGHPLDEQIFDRIKKVKEKFPQVPMSIDGGINITNYQALQNAGADRLVVGSGFQELWKSLTKN
ncbi:MAG: hypothetical protein Q7R69_02990 [bacterium]|nr:hypothetical protein [bacterium]